jgi:hypothetical protein
MLGGSMAVQGTRHLRLFILFSCWVLQGSPEQCPFEWFSVVFNLCCNLQALILWLLYGPGHNSWEDSRTPHSRECTTKDRKYWCQCNLITVSGKCLTRGFLALSLSFSDCGCTFSSFRNMVLDTLTEMQMGLCWEWGICPKPSCELYCTCNGFSSNFFHLPIIQNTKVSKPFPPMGAGCWNERDVYSLEDYVF